MTETNYCLKTGTRSPVDPELLNDKLTDRHQAFRNIEGSPLDSANLKEEIYLLSEPLDCASEPGREEGQYKSTGGILYKSDIPRAIWNPPLTRRGSLQPEDIIVSSAGGADGSQEPCQLTNSGRMYCRSASWLSSRTSLPLLNPDIKQDGFESNGGSDHIGEWPLPSTPSERETNSNSERLNLDLSNIHKNPEINARLVRREKIAFFDKECSKAAEHVFLGGDAVAKDKDIIKQNGITHVLNYVGFVCPEYFKSDFVYQTLWLHDSPSEDITSILYDVFDYFEDVREKHGRGFVHCYQGVSWSS
ncbi:hypothetical protein T459_33833 [Capsicum annuum]|uniref:Dual specificity phosphatase catalytic domain-containing protein n=1 Tax=Capsicum annuum TaxID=4072 RepID=A0A2G2XXU7_CAPAN|nr:hypothetical protein T459_33833 [Capsicum annuum]